MNAIETQVREAIKLMQKETGMHASRSWQMLEKYDAVEMLVRLMNNNADVQSGFKALYRAGLLDKSFESIIVHNKDIFPPETVSIAQWRLDNADELDQLE